MKVWTDKDGNKLDAKQFVQRWKEGVSKVTPLQQTSSQLFFTWITLVGITCGIILTAYMFSTLWWVCIILVAAFGNTVVTQIGLYQRYLAIVNIERILKEREGEHEQESTA